MIWEWRCAIGLGSILFSSALLLHITSSKICNVWSYGKNASERPHFSAFAMGAKTPQCTWIVQHQIASYFIHRMHTTHRKLLTFEDTYK